MKKILSSILFFAFIVTSHVSLHANVSSDENLKLSVMTFEEFQQLLTPKDDKIYVFNFWATWCRPCIKELPYFEELNARYKDKGVEVYLVSLDFIDHLESHLIPFLERNPKSINVILLNAPRYNQWIHKVSDEWSGAIPATIFITNRGQTQHFFQQEFNFQQLEDIITPLIN